MTRRRPAGQISRTRADTECRICKRRPECQHSIQSIEHAPRTARDQSNMLSHFENHLHLHAGIARGLGKTTECIELSIERLYGGPCAVAAFGAACFPCGHRGVICTNGCCVPFGIIRGMDTESGELDLPIGRFETYLQLSTGIAEALQPPIGPDSRI